MEKIPRKFLVEWEMYFSIFFFWKPREIISVNSIAISWGFKKIREKMLDCRWMPEAIYARFL